MSGASHPRVISIPGPPVAERKKRASGAALPLTQIACAIALAVLTFVGAAGLLEKIVYWDGTFHLRSTTMLEDDLTRLNQAGWGLAMAVDALRNETAAGRGGLTLAFTQAEIGYYGDLPFISYFDERALPFFQTSSKEELWRLLRARGVRFVLQPGYPLAEITNTHFDALLSDPALTEVIFSKEGNRVMRLLDAASAVTPRFIAGEGTGGVPFALTDWSTSSYRASPAAAVLMRDNGLYVHIPRRPFEDRQRWDYVRRGDLINGAPPAFEAAPGVSTLSVDLTARGRVDLFVVHPTEEGGYGETMIWTGVLLGERRTIGGQFTVTGDRQQPVGFVLRSYRVAPYLIHGWRADTYSQYATLAPVVSPAPRATIDTTLHLFASEAPENTSAAIEAMLGAGRAHADLAILGVDEAFDLTYFCGDGREITGRIDTPDDGHAALQCWPRAVLITIAANADTPGVRIDATASDGQPLGSYQLSHISN